VLITALVFAGALFAADTGTPSHGAQNADTEVAVKDAVNEHRARIMAIAFIAAAVAFCGGAVAAGIAIANVGSAAMGAIAEKPEVAGQALIFIALAEGLVVFGFITALMILGKV